MGLVSTQLFVGTRCRLSRHRDARFIHGWVQYFRGASLVVTTDDASGSEVGDSFYVEAYGPKSKACMRAVLRLVETEDGSPEQGDLTRLTLQLDGHLQVMDHSEPSRILVHDMFATVEAGGVEHKAQIRDVSEKGIGLLADVDLPAGTEVRLSIGTSAGNVAAKGVVRHARKYRGRYRLGIELLDFSRLDGSRWKKLFGVAA